MYNLYLNHYVINCITINEILLQLFSKMKFEVENEHLLLVTVILNKVNELKKSDLKELKYYPIQ